MRDIHLFLAFLVDVALVHLAQVLAVVVKLLQGTEDLSVAGDEACPVQTTPERGRAQQGFQVRVVKRLVFVGHQQEIRVGHVEIEVSCAFVYLSKNFVIYCTCGSVNSEQCENGVGV